MKTRYPTLLLALIGALITLPPVDTSAQGDFATSLHATRAGKNFWYGQENGGFETFTQIPIEDLGCTECHGPTNANGNPYDPYAGPNCLDCHSSHEPNLSETQCLGCHGRQATEAIALGISDVHRDAGMVCWDCHSSADMHGDGTPYDSMLQPGAIGIDCEDCHQSLPPSHASNDPHGGALHCAACHAQSVISCYNCHFESQVAGVKRAQRPISDFVMLVNRTKDSKVYPATFQSLTYAGSAFVAFAPYYPHTITRTGARTCTDCHVNFGGSNPSILQYNATGTIDFASWSDNDSTLSWVHGIVPVPQDYESALRMDFLTFDGDPATPAGQDDKNWSFLGKDTWDGHQMFFATPLTWDQMAKIGFDINTATEAGVPSLGAAYAYPNPFNSATAITYRLPEAGRVRVAIYDLTGKRVAVLVEEQKPAGTHEATWEGRDDDHMAVASGTYLGHVETEQGTQTAKLTLVK